jgi:tetratricopeptide (TPR) repeat protein
MPDITAPASLSESLGSPPMRPGRPRAFRAWFISIAPVFLVLFHLTIGFTGCASQVRLATPETPFQAIAWSAPKGEIWLAADSVFALREDPAKVRQAEALYAQAVVRQPDVPELLTRWSRACYLTALYGGLEADQRLSAFRRGIDAGERALNLHPGYARILSETSDETEAASTLDGHFLETAYWVAVNEGRLLNESDRFVRQGRASEVEALVKRMLALSDTLFAGGPHRLAAVLALRSPHGEIEQAKAHFAKAQSLAPDYLGNHTAYAEFFAPATGDRAAYVNTLESVSEARLDPSSPYAPENQLERLRARRLLRDAESLFSDKATSAEP